MSIPARSADTPADEVRALIQQAEDRINIFALPSFEMKANLQVDVAGEMTNGLYTLLWNGPEQWREEITFPWYSETQIGSKGSIFIKRSTDFLPVRIQQLRSTLGYGSISGNGAFAFLRPGPRESMKKPSVRNKDGRKLKCVEIVRSSGDAEYKREICIDAATGDFVRQGFADKDMMTFGGKFFPRYLSFVENGKLLVVVQVTEVSVPGSFSVDAFDIPPGAMPHSGCMNPFPPTILKQERPQYPEAERLSRTSGTVHVYSVVGTDGTLQHERVLSAPSPGLKVAALDAIQHWRYEPATCNGSPVDIETVITITFTFDR